MTFSVTQIGTWRCVGVPASSPSGVGQHVPTLVFKGYQGRACQFGIRAWFVQSILRIFRYCSGVSVITSFGCHDFQICCYLTW